MPIKKDDLIAITAVEGSSPEDPDAVYQARLVGPHAGRTGTVGKIARRYFDLAIA